MKEASRSFFQDNLTSSVQSLKVWIRGALLFSLLMKGYSPRTC